jgi:hypothetical protein
MPGSPVGQPRMPGPEAARRLRARPEWRRDEALARAGFGDIFKALKDKENELALALLPGVLAELDSVLDSGGCGSGRARK